MVISSDRIRAAAAATADPEGASARMIPVLEADPGIAGDPALLARLAHVCGMSRALARALATRPELLATEPDSWRESVPLSMRAMLVAVLGDEMNGLDVAETTRRLSGQIDILVTDRLVEARRHVSERHPAVTDLRLALVAMGKWGAGEINYYSDLDMIFVHEAPPGEENEARTVAFALVGRLIADLSTTTVEGTAFKVDLDLRPEGAIGPLSRSLDSYRSYYERWGEPWELQALLKARPVAGDPDLGVRFRGMADEVVWERGLDAEALRSIRVLKARAEEEASPRDIKRSAGGIRDIEFAVQLLQLVHGRLDPDLRVLPTLEAIAVLGEHGYIEETEAARLSDAYRFLRNLEHRVQIWDLTQTHLVPDAHADKERIGRSLGLGTDPGVELDRRLAVVRREVRDLHERLYFRPILDSLAGSTTARLGPAEATIRLEALGFRDVTAATRAFEDMTGGLSRRSRAMQQVLPLILDWLSQTPDPDLGLSQMRVLLANTTDHGALVTLLQGNPVAGERLCRLLGTGRLLGDLIDRIPEFIPRLAEDDPTWDIRDAAGATARLVALLDSRPHPDARVGTIRRFIRRRKLRIAARDVLEEADTETTLEALSDSADAAVAGGLHALGAPSVLGVVAMGKWGGRELSYGSDLDLMYVYPGETERETAGRMATELERVISEPGRHGDGYHLDSELRPEGRRGPLARSVESYRRYYREWAEPWELLALVKARPAAGDPAVLNSFTEVIGPVLWGRVPDQGVLREIRAIKARVEAERIPFGQDPGFHLKLGPGGLSDIEFLTQLLQLRHGSLVPEVRVTPTLPALKALRDAERLDSESHQTLHESYLFLTKVRLRLHLQRGQTTDWFPQHPDQRSSLATSLGYDRQGDLVEEYRRHARRTRRVFEALFYD
ncbi:MAG: bifunctional [glutamine synthetase] adenylyltransferase/[glutamine synthetase]-adenylyl-L-tyrosine phosphorylase [Actinobacteria bacterium]|nr:bifunctional [glutamine synthetase] adenylyltransferase/[glutamine synthetase]-adenylyl-L-tyrosine phosphorylase [Actinomycetota bacterium]